MDTSLHTDKEKEVDFHVLFFIHLVIILRCDMQRSIIFHIVSKTADESSALKPTPQSNLLCCIPHMWQNIIWH